MPASRAGSPDVPQKCRVRVVARFRPAQAGEDVASSAAVAFPTEGVDGFASPTSVSITPGASKTLSGDPDNFTFDRVYGPDSTQEDIFDSSVQDLVRDVPLGFNVTVFAYGQTGSGKTHTMFGPPVEGASGRGHHNTGIIPKAIDLLFEKIREDTSGTQYLIKVSFVEIYKEELRDLLRPDGGRLRLRESPYDGVFVENLHHEYVTSREDVLELLTLGDSYRHIASTNVNEVSSRSHSLFVLDVEQRLPDGSVRTGRLNLADLAGSERVSKTGADGEILEEAKRINQSLSALGNCINALTQRKRPHIPFRDSKLTFLLRDSLGGNSKTCLVLACSTTMADIEETVSTLRFGQRAKHIKNNVCVNRKLGPDELEAMYKRLQEEYNVLKTYCRGLEHKVGRLDAELATAKKDAIERFLRQQQQQSTASTDNGNVSPTLALAKQCVRSVAERVSEDGVGLERQPANFVATSGESASAVSTAAAAATIQQDTTMSDTLQDILSLEEDFADDQEEEVPKKHAAPSDSAAVSKEQPREPAVAPSPGMAPQNAVKREAVAPASVKGVTTVDAAVDSAAPPIVPTESGQISAASTDAGSRGDSGEDDSGSEELRDMRGSLTYWIDRARVERDRFQEREAQLSDDLVDERRQNEALLEELEALRSSMGDGAQIGDTGSPMSMSSTLPVFDATGRRELRRLRSDNEALRQQHSELEARLRARTILDSASRTRDRTQSSNDEVERLKAELEKALGQLKTYESQNSLNETKVAAEPATPRLLKPVAGGKSSVLALLRLRRSVEMGKSSGRMPVKPLATANS